MLIYLPALVAVAAVALTYLLCIRPMRRGNSCFQAMPDRDDERGREFERVRTELELLRLRKRKRQQAQAG